MPEYKQNPRPPKGLDGSSEETLASVESLRSETDAAEARLRERLLKDAEDKVVEAQEPGEA